MKATTTSVLRLSDRVRLLAHAGPAASATIVAIVHGKGISVRLKEGTSPCFLHQTEDGSWRDGVGNLFSVHF